MHELDHPDNTIAAPAAADLRKSRLSNFNLLSNYTSPFKMSVEAIELRKEQKFLPELYLSSEDK